MTDRRIQLGDDGRPVPKPVNEFTADDAKALVEQYNTIGDAELQEILRKVLTSIKSGAARGERMFSFSHEIYGRHRDGLQNLLQLRGFVVKLTDDQRDGSYMSVKF